MRAGTVSAINNFFPRRAPDRGENRTRMSLSPKQGFIEAFFKEFERKLGRLEDLRSRTFEDEAFTLCLVYIDRLASGHYGGKYGQNRKNFWRALTELSHNPLFGMIYPQRLLEETKAQWPSAVSLIESIVSREPRALLDENKLAENIRSSSLTDREKVKLISNLWRASIANISYDYIRNTEVHGPGSGGLSFDESAYEGQVGVTLDFKIFFDALCSILSRVTEMSISSSQWFGNPNYIKERK
jgi:hypothetical protein